MPSMEDMLEEKAAAEQPKPAEPSPPPRPRQRRNSIAGPMPSQMPSEMPSSSDVGRPRRPSMDMSSEKRSFGATLDDALAKAAASGGSASEMVPTLAKPRRRGRSMSVADLSQLAGFAAAQEAKPAIKVKRRRKKGACFKDDESMENMFETFEMLQKRRELKNDPKVLGALKAWWTAVDEDCSGAVDRDEYMELMKAIYRVKISDKMQDAMDCKKCAQQDTDEDFKGITLMDEAKFNDGIFQYATARAPPPPAHACARVCACVPVPFLRPSHGDWPSANTGSPTCGRIRSTLMSTPSFWSTSCRS